MARLVGKGNLLYRAKTSSMASADRPAAAAFHSDSGVIRYVWMCSGLFSSSANGASASRAAAYFGLSTSTRIERSLWTISGLEGSAMGAATADLRVGIGNERGSRWLAMRPITVIGLVYDRPRQAIKAKCGREPPPRAIPIRVQSCCFPD